LRDDGIGLLMSPLIVRAQCLLLALSRHDDYVRFRG